MKNNKKRNNQFKTLIIVCIIAVFGISSIFTINYYRIHDLILNKDIEQMVSTSKYVTHMVETQIENVISNLMTKTRVFTEHEIHSSAQVQKRLNSICEDLGFVNTGIVDLEGNSYDRHGEISIIDNLEIQKKLKNNAVFVSNVIDVSDCMIVVVPLSTQDGIIGGLWGYYQVERIAQRIELDEDSHRYFQIVDDSGEYISDSNNKHSFSKNYNIWDELELYSIEDETVESIREKVKNKESGKFYFTYQGEGRYVAYEPIHINNWYVFSVLTENYLSDYVRDIENAFFLMLFLILLCIVAVLLAISRIILENTRLIKKQNSQLISLNSLFYMTLTHTNDVPFEIDLDKNIITFFSSKADKNMQKIQLDICHPDNLIQEGILDKDYYEAYITLYDNIMHKKVSPVIPIRIFVDGSWNVIQIYYEIHDGKIVGCLEDYSEQADQNLKIQEMKNKSQIDSLTGLYNRDYMKDIIEHALNNPDNENISAIYILDLDYFKQANDNLGHLIGDQILTESAKLIRDCVRSSDVCGRLGGDEFILFVHGVQDIHGLEVIANKINEAVCRTYTSEGKQVTISASIGVCVLKPNMSIDTLYDLADKALYKVKEKGRNGFYIYDEIE